METDKTAVGKRIKDIRQENGYSMKEFGIEIGKLLGTERVKEGIISRWENGVSLPNNERLKAIAEIGETTVDKLLNSDVTNDDILKMAERLIYSTVERIFVEKVINYHEERLKLYDYFMSEMESIDETKTDNNAVDLLESLRNEISKRKPHSPKWTPLEQNAFDIINSDNSNSNELHEYIHSLSIEEIINFLPKGELEKELNKDAELIFEINYEHETITVQEK